VGVKVRKPRDHRSWCVVIDHQGQRRTVAVGTREAAERVRREIEARLALGESFAPNKPTVPTFDEYSQMWLRIVEMERKPSTAGFYGQYLRLYAVPRFGAQRLDGIRREDVKRFIAELREKGLARNTIRLAVTAVRAVLKQRSRIGSSNTIRRKDSAALSNPRNPSVRRPRSGQPKSYICCGPRVRISISAGMR
jgi:hypothetical protein